MIVLDVKHCKNASVVESKGFLICTGCGQSLGRMFVTHAARAYDHEKIKKVSQHAPFKRSHSPRTVIQYSDVVSVKSKRKSEWRRLREENKWFAGDNTYAYHQKEFDSIVGHLTLPEDVKEMAWKLLIENSKRKYTRGKTLDGMIKACLFYAGKIQSFPLFLNELVFVNADNDAGKEERKAMRKQVNNSIRCVNDVIRELKLKPKPHSVSSIVNRIANCLKLNPTQRMKLIRESILLHDHLSKNEMRININNVPPVSAAFLYISSLSGNINIQQQDICRVVRISEVTLRSRVDEILFEFQRINKIEPIVNRKEFEYKKIYEHVFGILENKKIEYPHPTMEMVEMVQGY